VRTYGDIAREIGEPHATQAVGAALGRNPVPIIIPCHRVLGAGGKAGGFSAPGGTATKFRMLEIEGARRPGDPELFETLPLKVKPSS
jgi:methylated-DNA-[protein]-cysteine S-methyltransferase